MDSGDNKRSRIDKAYEAGKGAFKSAEDDASKDDGKPLSAKAAEGIKNAAMASASVAGAAAGGAAAGGKDPKGLFSGKGKPSPDDGKKSKGKLSLAKGAGLFVALLLLGAIALIVGISNTFQLTSKIINESLKEDKTVAVIEARSEYDLARRLESTDPADRLSDRLISLLNEAGFEYIEQDNGDGTVARALIYNEDPTTLIASTNVKNTLMANLSTSGSIIDNFRDVSTFFAANDQASAAMFYVLSVIATAAHYDDDAVLMYQRRGVDAGKYRNVGYATDEEKIHEATKAGSVNEGINSTSGTTSRYVWTEHEYTIVGVGNTTCWDWDANSPDLDGSTRTKRVSMGDNGACEGDPDPKPFSGDEVNTGISATADATAIKNALDRRAILSAFSTNPNFQNGNLARSGITSRNTLAASTPSSTPAEIKSDNSTAAAVSGMVKNKAFNVAQSIATAVQQMQAGDGGAQLNDWENRWNTPTESCNVDKTYCSNFAATETDAFNSTFTESIILTDVNPIVKKWNTAASLSDEDIDSTLIQNDISGNYNNIKNTSKVAQSSEDMTNSTISPDSDKKYYYCEAADGADTSKCPEKHQTLNPNDYVVSDEVAAYVESFTAIDLASDPGGEDGAVAFEMGFADLNDSLLRQSSGAYGTEESALAFYGLAREYLAKAANYDRQTKSPFDASSPHTFLGSIVSSLIPFTSKNGNNTIFSAITSGLSSFSSSVSSLLPSASAIDGINYLTMATTDNCVAKASSNMVCNIFGEPVTIMEMDYMHTPPQEIADWMEASGYVIPKTTTTAAVATDDNGIILTNINAPEPAIKQYEVNPNPPATDSSGNPYNKYSDDWLFCTNNDSIVNNSTTLETDSGKKPGFWSKIIAKIKKFFHIGDMVARNQSACGGDYGLASLGEAEATVTAEEYKKFSQFTLDQRYAVLAGYIDESASTAYLKKYYEENPLDTSYEAVIARLSGLTTEEVLAAFDYMEYEVYLATYDPSTRYGFIDGLFLPDPVPVVDDSVKDPFAAAAVVAKMAEYAEMRSRNFLV